MSAAGSVFDEDEEYEPAWWVHCHDDEEDRQSSYANINWLFDQRLPRTGVALLIGPSEIGKTFVAIDATRAVATEGDFFGLKPNTSAGAVILAGEDAHGTRHRVLALGDQSLAIRVAEVEDLRSEKAQRCVRDLLQEARNAFREKQLARELGLVVVDTLPASGLLADENSNAMCAEAMRVLASMARRFQCLVLVIHHPGKKGGGPRGGSALFASADVVMEVRPTKRPGIATLECVKNRNGPKGNWGSFRLEPCTVKTDVDGRDITTMRVVNVLNGSTSTAASLELASAIAAAMGSRVLRKDAQSADSVHPIIAECAGIEWSAAGATSRTNAILGALLASGALKQRTEYIGGKHRPVVFVSDEPARS